MIEIKLYNTMSRSVEVFKPIIPGEMKFYSCGPTVYHFAHIGNLRTYVSNDILKRAFIAAGYNVRHVMNITDVGHLTSDEDTGDDKMEKGAKRDGKSVWDIAKYYTEEFMRDIQELNILTPDIMPKATDYIAEQIELVQKLESLGLTYKIDGDGIYYDTSKFADYGKLARINPDELKAGTRIAFNEQKRNPPDFALWKFSPTDAKRQMEWDSPWGVGFPGWHIECSAMSMKTLGAHFDIHTGGVDHIKVHHTNEIAQSEPVVGAPWVNYWTHMEHLNDQTGKMSKSNGEFLTLTSLRSRGYDPLAYRYFLLLASYRTQIEFSFEALDAAVAAYSGVVRRVAAMLANPELPDDSRADIVIAGEWKRRLLSAVADDLGTPRAIAILHELLKDENVDDKTKLAVFEFADDLLGLVFIGAAKAWNGTREVKVEGELLRLVEARAAAKSAKDYAAADKIREQIEAMGYVVEDGKDGVKVARK